MLNATLIRKLFISLNEELAKLQVKGEVLLCGGAVMCLVFQLRKATKDIDAIFAPSTEIRKASQKVARRFALDQDWLNDAAKAYFLIDPPKQEVLELSHLRVWAPQADYMLAMKCIAARFDSHDREDVEFLIQYLELKSPVEVFERISKYYPRRQIPAKTQFLVEEILNGTV